MIERIEIHVTALSSRLKRIFASGTYDTGPEDSITSKPVLVKLHADGVVGYGQIRPISPGHFVADTTQSMVAAIREFYGPGMLGRSLFDTEAIHEMFDRRLAGNPAVDWLLSNGNTATNRAALVAFMADGAAIVPRDRRAAGAHLRRAAAVSPREIAAAAEKLLALRPATTEAELAAGIHRLMGLDANAQTAIAARLAGLIGAGVVKL